MKMRRLKKVENERDDVVDDDGVGRHEEGTQTGGNLREFHTRTLQNLLHNGS